MKRVIPLAALTAVLAALTWPSAGPTAPGATPAAGAEAPTSRLQTARYGHTSVVIGPFVYVLGGMDGARPTSDVERAPILPGGSLGDFYSVAPLRLARSRAGHASARVGDRLYVLGGRDGAGFLGSVEQSPIGPDGALGPFAPVPGAALHTPRGLPASAVIGGHLYLIGGHGSAGILGSVERAAIGPDGGLGPFQPVPELKLSTPRTCHASAVIGPSVYVLGGVDRQGRVLDSVERATLEPDGVLGPFRTLHDVRLRTARSTPSGLLDAPFLYVFGGSNNSRTTFASVERARVHQDGSLGPFVSVEESKLSIARSFHTSVKAGDAIYLLGGQDDRFRLLTSVERLTRPGTDRPPKTSRR